MLNIDFLNEESHTRTQAVPYSAQGECRETQKIRLDKSVVQPRSQQFDHGVFPHENRRARAPSEGVVRVAPHRPRDPAAPTPTDRLHVHGQTDLGLRVRTVTRDARNALRVVGAAHRECRSQSPKAARSARSGYRFNRAHYGLHPS